jgi:hypothetical protein
MAFKLLIECSKDIDTLHINFSDGTSVVTSNEDKPEKVKEHKEHKEHKEEKSTTEKPKRKYLEQYLNTDEDFTVNQEIIEKPKIEDLVRPPKVTDELQNLDF